MPLFFVIAKTCQRVQKSTQKVLKSTKNKAKKGPTNAKKKVLKRAENGQQMPNKKCQKCQQVPASAKKWAESCRKKGCHCIGTTICTQREIFLKVM